MPGWGNSGGLFFRMGAALLAMPFFGDALIPVWIRALLTLSLVFITAPLMPAMPAVDLLSFTAIGLALEQAVWGIFFGLILHLLFTYRTHYAGTNCLNADGAGNGHHE